MPIMQQNMLHVLCGRGELQQDAALYYFGPADGPPEGTVIDQLQLAPTILTRLGAPVPETMKAGSFLW